MATNTGNRQLCYDNESGEDHYAIDDHGTPKDRIPYSCKDPNAKNERKRRDRWLTKVGTRDQKASGHRSVKSDIRGIVAGMENHMFGRQGHLHGISLEKGVNAKREPRRRFRRQWSKELKTKDQKVRSDKSIKSGSQAIFNDDNNEDYELVDVLNLLLQAAKEDEDDEMTELIVAYKPASFLKSSLGRDAANDVERKRVHWDDSVDSDHEDNSLLLISKEDEVKMRPIADKPTSCPRSSLGRNAAYMTERRDVCRNDHVDRGDFELADVLNSLLQIAKEDEGKMETTIEEKPASRLKSSLGGTVTNTAKMSDDRLTEISRSFKMSAENYQEEGMPFKESTTTCGVIGVLHSRETEIIEGQACMEPSNQLMEKSKVPIGEGTSKTNDNSDLPNPRRQDEKKSSPRSYRRRVRVDRCNNPSVPLGNIMDMFHDNAKSKRRGVGGIKTSLPTRQVNSRDAFENATSTISSILYSR